MCTEFGSGGKSNKTTPSSTVGLFHELPTELQDTLVLTRKLQSDGDRKGFEAACREQALMKATTTKSKCNKKLKIAEAVWIEASYLYQQYQHSSRCTKTPKEAFDILNALT